MGFYFGENGAAAPCQQFAQLQTIYNF